MPCQKKTDHRTGDHSHIIQEESIYRTKYCYADDTAYATGNYRDHYLYGLKEKETQRSQGSCFAEKLLHGFLRRKDAALITCPEGKEESSSADYRQFVFF